MGGLKRSLSAVAIALLAAGLLLEAPNVAASSDQSGAPRTPASNQAAAQSDASSLLAKLSLPSDVTPSSTEPAGDGGALANPGVSEATPNLVDDHAWWVAPSLPGEILSYVDANPPVGSKPAGSGGGSTQNGTAISFQVFGWPPVPNVLSTRWLVITVAALTDGQTGVRADSEDVWITPRPASEQVPPGVQAVNVTIQSLGGRRSLPQIVRSAAKVRRIIALADGLPAAQPGVESCPADFGPTVQLAFLSAPGAQTLANLNADSSGCGSVEFSVGGVSELGLADGGSVIAGLDTPGVFPVCTAVQLHATSSLPRTEPFGTSATFTFRNRSRMACALAGYPHLKLRGKDGSPLATVVKDHRAEAGRAPVVTLAPDASALLPVNWKPPSRSCGGLRAHTVVIHLPRVHRRIAVRVGSAKHPFSPCGLSVSYLEPYP